jgi:hypothetical protein
MKGILSTLVMAAGLIAIATASVHAESKGSGSNRPDADRLQWRQISDDVSASEYRKTYRHNKRVLRSALKLYSESAAESMGLPETAKQLVGGAAGAAANLLTNHDVRFGLNDKKTFAFEVRDPADNDRALFLNYKLKW